MKVSKKYCYESAYFYVKNHKTETDLKLCDTLGMSLDSIRQIRKDVLNRYLEEKSKEATRKIRQEKQAYNRKPLDELTYSFDELSQDEKAIYKKL